MPVPGNTVSSLWSESSQHAWTVTHAWNTTKSFAQTGESLKLSATDNWSESTLMHVSNTRTDSLVTLLTFDSRWRGLLSDGVDSFSVCEVISCQWHCEGAKEAVLGDLRGGYTDGGGAEPNRAKKVLCKKYCTWTTYFILVSRSQQILYKPFYYCMKSAQKGDWRLQRCVCVYCDRLVQGGIPAFPKLGYLTLRTKCS